MAAARPLPIEPRHHAAGERRIVGMPRLEHAQHAVRVPGVEAVELGPELRLQRLVARPQRERIERCDGRIEPLALDQIDEEIPGHLGIGEKLHRLAVAGQRLQVLGARHLGRDLSDLEQQRVEPPEQRIAHAAIGPRGKLRRRAPGAGPPQPAPEPAEPEPGAECEENEEARRHGAGC